MLHRRLTARGAVVSLSGLLIVRPAHGHVTSRCGPMALLWGEGHSLRYLERLSRLGERVCGEPSVGLLCRTLVNVSVLAKYRRRRTCNGRINQASGDVDIERSQYFSRTGFDGKGRRRAPGSLSAFTECIDIRPCTIAEGLAKEVQSLRYWNRLGRRRRRRRGRLGELAF